MRWIQNIWTWVPQQYSQGEVLAILGLDKNEKARRIFTNAAIEHRHLLGDPTEWLRGVVPDPHLPEPTAMFPNMWQIAHIVEVSSLSRPYFRLAASSHELLSRRWCAGGIHGLEMTARHGGRSVLFTVDINSALRWQPDFRNVEDVIAFALFGDGVACVEVGDSPGNTLGPRVVGFSHYHDAESDLVRFEGRGLSLSREIPKKVPPLIEKCVRNLLGKHGLVIADIEHWIVHTGGRKILDCLEEQLGIQGRLESSREVLRRHGNLSASSTFFVLKEVMASHPDPGSYAVMVAYGLGSPRGFSVVACLLQW